MLPVRDFLARVKQLEADLAQANARYQDLAATLGNKTDQSKNKMDELAVKIGQLAAAKTAAQGNEMQGVSGTPASHANCDG